MTQPLLVWEGTWVPMRDGDPSVMAIAGRHYTNRIGKAIRQCVGPGEKMVLMTPDGRALFAWRKFKSDAGEEGVNCAIFRNEGRAQASDLIHEADSLDWNRWRGERLYTYVNDRKVEHKRQPRRCFLKAGWHYVRASNGKPKRTKKRGLLVLECLPEAAVK